MGFYSIHLIKEVNSTTVSNNTLLIIVFICMCESVRPLHSPVTLFVLFMPLGCHWCYRACKLFNIRLYAILCFNYFWWHRRMFSYGSVFELL